MVAPFILVHFGIAEEIIPVLHRVRAHDDRRGHVRDTLEKWLKAHLMDERNLAVARVHVADGKPVVSANVAGEKAALLFVENAHLFGFVGHQLHREHTVRAAGLALKSIHGVTVGIDGEAP